jgi:hypothetical protein
LTSFTMNWPKYHKTKSSENEQSKSEKKRKNITFTYHAVTIMQLQRKFIWCYIWDMQTLWHIK